ncbi:MAG TPA: tRNA (adenosine(37)-N6)-threonylcarbamoyltransferase complex transferase subunit TsaD [Bdellovibrionales bacterium]|nr:tRNA (adenosine(37)-N6)-threonylcarbamoyltransferase complex transferase subunit TsaD [Bdellovibrionales bacterium]HCM39772.1 tRNA (adenosine(37)-N6)-threonylcarbamoyltransferase complex transferase subunit TsaD [Bdellovibrionales bacterium]
MAKETLVLGIESSCDECSATVVRHQSGVPVEVLSLATYSQIGLHRPYGGVVPEIASRNHLETVNHMIDQALTEAGVSTAEVDVIAVTNRPGLAGALLVGISAAKAMAYALNKPLIPVHHLEGHASSIFLKGSNLLQPDQLPLPLLVAIVSGGHTNLYTFKTLPELWPPDLLKRSLVGRSRDDAAGEAFDKTAKTLGFPYPGGVWIDKTAKSGNPEVFKLPRALPQKATLDFSFSGLKTAVVLETQKLKAAGTLEERLPDLCASIQEAIVDALLTKIYLAIRMHGCRALAVVGGVAANSRLRERLQAEWAAYGLKHEPIFPKLEYCSDNAAMVGAAGAFRYRQGQFIRGTDLLTLNAIPNPEV